MDLNALDLRKTALSALTQLIEEKKQEILKQALAASRIQAAALGHRQRSNLSIIRHSAQLIQAAHRRRVAVLSTQRLYDATQYQKRCEFYARMATRIQAAYRGFAIRRDVLDAARRRQYLAQATVAAAEAVENCRAYNEYCEATNMQAALEVQAALAKKLGKLHHMRSTKAQAGVFKPAYPVLPPTVGGKAVDEVLKEEGRKQTKVVKRAPKILDNLKSCVKDV